MSAAAAVRLPQQGPEIVPCGYRPELDVLRFFCFLLVFIHHTASGMATRLPGTGARWGAALVTASGFGADLFFVLSSFLITTLLLRESKLTGTVNVRSFYLRRALRLWPLYFVALALILVLERLQPAYMRLQSFHVLAMLLFAGNWALAVYPVATLAGPLWSVSMQEQFYLVWPWLVRKTRIATLVAVCWLAIACGCAFRFWAVHTNAEWQFIHFSTFSVLDVLALGALVAIAFRGSTVHISSLLRLVLAAVCIAGWFWVSFPGKEETFRSESGLKLWYPLTALCSAGLLMVVLDIRGRATSILHSRSLVYLGRISYGLYIWHPILIFAMNKVVVPAWMHAARVRRWHHAELWVWLSAELLLFACTVGLASISYHWLERPCQQLKHRLQAKDPLVLEMKKVNRRVEASAACQRAAG